MKKTGIILGAIITVGVFIFVMPFVSGQQQDSKVKLTEQKIEPVKTTQEQVVTTNISQKNYSNKPVEKQMNSLNQQQPESDKLATQQADIIAQQVAAQQAADRLAAEETAVQQQNNNRLSIEHEENDD